MELLLPCCVALLIKTNIVLMVYFQPFPVSNAIWGGAETQRQYKIYGYFPGSGLFPVVVFLPAASAYVSIMVMRRHINPVLMII